jgi:hypothetical protein
MPALHHSKTRASRVIQRPQQGANVRRFADPSIRAFSAMDEFFADSRL